MKAIVSAWTETKRTEVSRSDATTKPPFDEALSLRPFAHAHAHEDEHEHEHEDEHEHEYVTLT